MKNIIDTITKVGQALLNAGEDFAWSPVGEGEASYLDPFPGKDTVIVWDDDERREWSARLDLDVTPADPCRVSHLVTSVLGAPSRVNDNTTWNWDADGVLVVCDNDSVEFFQRYDKFARTA